MAHRLPKLDASKTLFLLCDVQEKFRSAIPLFGNMVQNINKLLQVGKAFEIPLIATEQYPKGLGNTIKEIDTSSALAVIPRTKFTMYVPEMLCFMKELLPAPPEDVVIFGLETHVCVLQSAIDFIENNYKVHVVADCCCSRLNQDRDVSLDLLQHIGCFVQTSESVIFNLAQDKMHPQFEAVKRAVREVSADMELAKIDSKTEKENETHKKSSLEESSKKIAGRPIDTKAKDDKKATEKKPVDGKKIKKRD